MVVDELIVIVGLDSSQFNEAQRAALELFKKNVDEMDKQSKRVEAQGKSLTSVFAGLRRTVLGAFAAIVGNEFMQMVDRVNTMDAATGRWARSMDHSVEGLSTWQNMIRQVGGNAENATSALSAMQNELNNVRQGGGIFSQGFGYLLNKIGGAQGKGADQILRELHTYFNQEIAAGRETTGSATTYLRRVPGMNQDMINLILSTPETFAKIEKEVKKIGTATKDSADSAERYVASLGKIQSSWDALARVSTNIATGPIIWVMDRITKMLVEFSRGQFISPDSLLGKAMGIKPLAEPGEGGKSGQRASAADREAWIKSIAQGLGIDPQVALRVAKTEGFNNYQSSIPGEQSFGDFQLNMIKGNLGDQFQKETGLDPRDPANERAMDEYALKHVAKHGWKAFHGAKNDGIGQWEGIGAGSAAGARSGAAGNRSSSMTTNTTNIAKVEVVTQATDAQGIANDMMPAIKYAALTAPANSGLS